MALGGLECRWSAVSGVEMDGIDVWRFEDVCKKVHWVLVSVRSVTLVGCQPPLSCSEVSQPKKNLIGMYRWPAGTLHLRRRYTLPLQGIGSFPFFLSFLPSFFLSFFFSFFFSFFLSFCFLAKLFSCQMTYALAALWTKLSVV